MWQKRTGSGGQGAECEIDHESTAIDVQLLDWHAGATTVDMEAFQLWALAGLRALVRLDGAVWGAMDAPAESHVHRTRSDVLRGPEGALLLQQLAATASGRVVQCDPGGGIDSAIGLRWTDPASGNDQFMLLRRDRPDDLFDAGERAALGRLGPHMMLAFATCRRLQVADAARRGGAGSVRASALVDRSGRIHESDSRFLRTLRREWPDCTGARLPDPLLHHKARRVASRWQFRGVEITVDVEPVNSLYLVTARLRLPADTLTPREWEIARRYAGGSEFRDVADALQVAPATVRSHLRRVFSKLGVHNKSQLIARLE